MLVELQTVSTHAFHPRFLWDAHNCEESLDEEELGVSSNYLNHWNDLVDLWYLGMQVLASLLTEVCDFYSARGRESGKACIIGDPKLACH